jgi:DNA-binding MarR family transcriptional regulator
VVKNRTEDSLALNTIVLLFRTFDGLKRFLDIQQASWGASPLQFAIMNAIYMHGGRMTPTALSKWVFRTRHTVTSDVSTLERMGFVQREPGVDRRSINIALTEKGLDRIRSITPLAQEISCIILSCLSDEEMETLRSLIRGMRKHLDKLIEQSTHRANTHQR